MTDSDLDLLPQIDTDRPLDVPLTERAEIRPRELAILRRRLVQAEGERDANEAIIRTLLSGLGFDPDNWWISAAGALGAVSTLKEILLGEIQREECIPVTAGTVIAIIFDLLEQVNGKGSAYPLRHEKPGVR